ncbi:MAG: hypothetical protein QXO30_01285 [Candidatus Caldarchaeum sp.]
MDELSLDHPEKATTTQLLATPRTASEPLTEKTRYQISMESVWLTGNL